MGVSPPVVVSKHDCCAEQCSVQYETVNSICTGTLPFDALKRAVTTEAREHVGGDWVARSASLQPCICHFAG